MVYEDKNQAQILEFLWQNYCEENPANDQWLKKQEDALKPVFAELSLSASDMLTELLVELCTAYQHAAFMEGIRIGFHLQKELQISPAGCAAPRLSCVKGKRSAVAVVNDSPVGCQSCDRAHRSELARHKP